MLGYTMGILYIIGEKTLDIKKIQSDLYIAIGYGVVYITDIIFLIFFVQVVGKE